MLQINKSPELYSDNIDYGPGESRSLSYYIKILRRQFPTILAILSSCIILALLYLFTAAPQFTSTASMVIDTRKVQLFQQQSVLGDVPIDSPAVETQVEILKSENVSLAVIKDLHLTDDPEFTGSGTGIVGAILKFLVSPFVASNSANDGNSEFVLTRKALGRFESNRTVKRIGLTYVMEIGFTSLDPEKAARIANSVADSYIVDQLEAKYQATRRASVWLQDRIKELRVQASIAQRAVVDFKQKSNIVDAGGRLMNEQQLAEVNSQLILTRASTAEAKARLDRIDDIVKQEIPDASVADALKNDTIVKLRGQYVDLASRESIFSSRYGRDHLAVVNLRVQMNEIKKNITDELKRIQQSYKSDYDIALTREESIKSSLANVVLESQSTNQAQIQLRELESNAQSYQAMYDNFLQRYMESVQQQSFPITEARVITPASRAFTKSSPKTMIVLAASLIGGLMLSVGAAMAREFGDNVFRTSNQVEEALQSNCLAILPALKSEGQRSPGKLLEVSSKAGRDGQGASSEESLLHYMVDHPLSRFSEAVRSLKVAIDLNSIVKENRVIAITSTLPNEGKSTLSTNLAYLMAHGGAKVILIDSDLRNPSLSRSLSAGDRPGLVDTIARTVRWEDAVIKDPVTTLSFLPAGATSKVLHSSEILASKMMSEFISKLKASYDYIVLDLPPLAPVVDARVTATFVDSYIYVVEWGKTKIDLVRQTLKSAPEIHNSLLGVVLNKADTTILARYEAHQGKYYYNKYYAKYGYSE